ncbi:DUF1768 domain-containing protein [Nocardia cyriacigeorgica]|uniref:DUF1768 domain-containing protein n=2 Tax=Nocardia cyriacigeorgica TaxID=135487 RepID=A0A5R8PBR1_9NOCA|nr:DUF1768 domain-containing protein [Nocardia cyriacigeorgica]
MSPCTRGDEMADLVIDAFEGQYRFLSNFSPDPAIYHGTWFPSAEHAFQATKTTDTAWVRRIASAATADEAKRLGRHAPLREDWEQIKHQVMVDIVRGKFSPGSDPATRLTATGDALLVEGNTWGDDYWGRSRRRGASTLVGRNMLGRTLMRVRHELRAEPVTRWYRVAVTGHREHAFDPDTRIWVRGELERLADKLRAEHGTGVALTGLATGADTWWAQAATNAGLSVWAYQPFPEQAARWTPAQQDEHARLQAHADRIVVAGDEFAVAHYDLRNALMIDDADAIIAVHDPRIRTGGTVSALRRYCPGRPVIKVNTATRETTATLAYTHAPWTSAHPDAVPQYAKPSVGSVISDAVSLAAGRDRFGIDEAAVAGDDPAWQPESEADPPTLPTGEPEMEHEP